MGGLFNIDGAFHRYASIVADVVVIGVLWTLTSLPLITIGASTTAAYYVFTKKVSGREGYIFSGFFKSFAQNFLRSTAAFLLLAVLFALLIFNVLTVEDMENLVSVTLIIQYFIFLQALFVMLYVFALISRFELRLFQAMRLAFLMANRHIVTTLLHLALLIILAVITYMLPFLIIFIMGLFCYLTSFRIVKIFRKHRPDFDPEVPTDLNPLQLDSPNEQNKP